MAFGILGIGKAETVSSDVAFSFKATIENNKVIIECLIKEGYYLYPAQFQFKIDGKNLEPDKHSFIGAKEHEDQFYGRVMILRDYAKISLTAPDFLFGSFDLTVVAQGCSDSGFCFLPFSRIFSLFIM